MSGNHPVVLCIGGHDPSGGAGIQADAEAVRAAGAWPCTVASCLTTQSTCGVEKVLPQPPEQILDQCRLVLEDSEVRACKIGLIGSAEAGLALGELLAEMRGVPVILDPVLASGSGDRLASSAIVEVLRETLLGRCTLVTPNLPEARALSGLRTPEECSRDLLARGCPWALVTGTHDETEEVVNRLHGVDGSRRQWRWPRLPHSYHGSGCTLASHLAGLVALGLDVPAAAERAQAFTWQTLDRALKTGRCQWTPNRQIRVDHEP